MGRSAEKENSFFIPVADEDGERQPEGDPDPGPRERLPHVHGPGLPVEHPEVQEQQEQDEPEERDPDPRHPGPLFLRAEDGIQLVEQRLVQLRHRFQLPLVEPHPLARRAPVHLDGTVLDLDEVHAALGALHVVERLEPLLLLRRELSLMLHFDLLLALELHPRKILLFLLGRLHRHRPSPFS